MLGHYIWVSKKIFSAANIFRRRFFKRLKTFTVKKSIFEQWFSTQDPQAFFKWGHGELFSRYLMM